MTKKDEKKEGGSYRKQIGNLRKFDAYGQILVFEDGTEICLEDILELA